MRVNIAGPLDQSSGFEDAPVFRVRLWQRPSDERLAWMLDEWEIHECTDVRDAIEWAIAQGASTYEVGVRWPDRAADADGRTVTRHRYTRVAGHPGDEEASNQVQIFFTTGE
jgi:hypothetical protein